MKKLIKVNLFSTMVLCLAAINSSNAIDIKLELDSSLTRKQQKVFVAAADRWESLLVGSLPAVRGNSGFDVVISAKSEYIDGPSGILGQAGPTRVRSGSFLPSRGIMEFDKADLKQMERDGSLSSVILHEMGHVLGFGTIFDDLQLNRRNQFVGPKATGAYSALTGKAEKNVPLETRGGPGTAGGHWHDDVFGNELMTGYLSAGVNPLSKLTAAAFEDLGYNVDYGVVEAYTLPQPGLVRLTTSPFTFKKMIRPTYIPVPTL